MKKHKKIIYSVTHLRKGEKFEKMIWWGVLSKLGWWEKENLARERAVVVWVLQTSVTGAAGIAGASEVLCLWSLV